jgi:hypothetical protein
MDEDRPIATRVQQTLHVIHFAVGGRMHVHRHSDKMHAKRFHHALLPPRLRAFVAQIDHGPNADFLERLKACLSGLAAAIKMFADLFETLYSGRLRGCQEEEED